MKSRRERRTEAKEKGESFQPIYSSGKRRTPNELVKNEDGTYTTVEGKIITVGGEPRTFEEVFGEGYERFNSKFVTIKEIEKETAEEAVIDAEG